MSGRRSDTIFALASGRGGASAVVRTSGPDTGSMIERMAGPVRPAPRRAAYRAVHTLDGEIIDRGLVLWFPGPASYTGEDCAELQLHAGPAIIEAVLATLIGLGARAADRGEFTLRAFLAGRVDLIEAEGIADLIAAETDEQRRQALAQAEGALSTVFVGWSDRLKQMLARQEALIDFPDETISDASADDWMSVETMRLAADLDTHLEHGRTAERLRDGIVIVLAGAPNVGKSSLMNRLALRDVAIVAPTPGTTRDRLEARVVISDVPVTLIDTAGLRSTDDLVEAEGVRRTRSALEDADLVILVRTAGTITEKDLAGDPRVVLVVNRIDEHPAPDGLLGVSATRGDHLDALRAHLATRVRSLARRREQPVATRARHRSCIEDARVSLLAAAAQEMPELRGEDLRRALASLGRLTGRVGVEDILSDIFSTFCIGK